MMAGEFFAIGKEQWETACALGLNAAIAFLVLARGTGADNSTTSWSAQSVTLQGISWRRSQQAILALESARLATNSTEAGKRKRPTRKLSIPSALDQAIWLPNSLVDGVGEAESPIARLRRAQNVEWLQAFVELYGIHDLAGDGGLPRTLVRQRFDGTHIADAGQFCIHGFKLSNTSCDLIGPLARFKEKYKVDGGSPVWIFLNTLKQMRLLEVVYYLAEGNSDESELLHPLTGDDRALGVAAAIDVAVESRREWITYVRERQDYSYIIPILRDYCSPAVFGIYRLTHRPHTKLTKAWYAKHCEACERFERVYDAIGNGNFRGAMGAHADIKVYQGEMKVTSRKRLQDREHEPETQTSR